MGKTVEEVAQFVSENLFGEPLNEDKPVRNLHIYAFVKLLFKFLDYK